MRHLQILPLALILFAAPLGAAEKEGWVELFDGTSLDGWKASENKDSWKVEDGALVAHGPRSHLFYVGSDKPFQNFELQLEVMTRPNSNAGVYFHTKYQEEGWPKHGFEAQVNNTYQRDPKKTGSLYGIVDVRKAPAEDNKWFTYTIKVEGNKVTTAVNGKTLVEYTEPAGQKAGKDFTRKLSSGTFALQAHDPKSEVRFRNIKVRRLP